MSNKPRVEEEPRDHSTAIDIVSPHSMQSLLDKKFLAFSGPVGKVLLTLAVGTQTLRLYRNWHYPFLDEFGILNSEYTLLLRNGTVFKCRPGTGDWHVVNEMWLSCPYLHPGHTLDTHSVVVDVGAHIGAFSILAATLVPEGKIYSYEASPANYRVFRDNIQLNNLEGKIVASQLAVCGSSGKRRLYLASKSTQSHSLVPEISNEGRSTEVGCVGLDEVFESREIMNCGLLKLDCEGAEYEILLTIKDKYLKRVKRISVEYHSVQGCNIATVRERLEGLGFDVALIDRPAGVLLSNKQVVYSARVLLARNRGAMHGI